MATPQTKSSQIPVKSTNPRNSEFNPMRRSFSGNPFADQRPSIIANQRPGFNPNTPANSPSDYPRRNSISRNTVVSLRDLEEKENQNSKIRSPASSKGTKNFMSPTISAASKISPSPKKKILAERNEPVRTSVSSSLDLKPEKGLNQKEEVSFDPTVTYLEDTEPLTFDEDTDSVANLESVASDDLVNLDPSFKISPRSSCSLPSPALAPLEADPSMPPYDPKTNYLSPRPQFLHYKRNPRIELYRDGKQLEESFASESSSEAEVTEEETVSDESSSDSHKEPEQDTKEEEEEEELLVSEPNPINAIKGAIEARKASRPHFLTRTKFIALLFVLAIAGLWASVSESPVMDPSVLNNLDFPSLYVPSEISEFTRENLEGLAQKFRQWFYDSLLYVHNLISSFIDQHKPGPLQFANLTILLEDGSVDNHILVDQSIFHAEVKYEIAEIQSLQMKPIQSLQEEDIEPDETDENVEKEDSNVVDVKTDEVADDKDQEFNFEVPVVHIVPELGEIEPSNSATELVQEIVTETDVVEQPVSLLKADEIEPEASYLKQPQAENVVSTTKIKCKTTEPEDIESDAETVNPQTAASAYTALDAIKNLFPVHATMGISLIALTLLAAISCFYMKNRTSTVPNRVPITKKFDQNPIQGTPVIAVQERYSSRPIMEVETLSESCPSDEMSSFHYSSSYNNQKKDTGEAQSREKRPKSHLRRESGASSDCSLGSASYGSFTTYEKVHVKYGNGEEEFVTPVRRSSRIRKQVTSP